MIHFWAPSTNLVVFSPHSFGARESAMLDRLRMPHRPLTLSTTERDAYVAHQRAVLTAAGERRRQMYLVRPRLYNVLRDPQRLVIVRVKVARREHVFRQLVFRLKYGQLSPRKAKVREMVRRHVTAEMPPGGILPVPAESEEALADFLLWCQEQGHAERPSRRETYLKIFTEDKPYHAWELRQPSEIADNGGSPTAHEDLPCF